MFDKYYIREYTPARKGEYDVTLADYSEAQNLLDWEPTKDLSNYIKSIR